MASYTAVPPSTGGGFKLKLSLGSTAPAQPAIPAPAPPLPPQQQQQRYHAPQQQEMPPPPPVAAAPLPVTGQAAAQWPGADEQQLQQQGGEGEQEEKTVAASKYRQLKRKYNDVVESRDETSLALFRAQKLVHRLREEKTALLDRVLLLETAAGLTSTEVDAAQESTTRSAHAQAFPLLHPPTLPATTDRPRPLPILNTSTDLSHSSYNDPIGEPPRPLSFPPRQRSTHLSTQLAAQKLRNEAEARRAAQALPTPTFPAVGILGLEGSYVAENVERAMLGERFPEPGAVLVESKPSSGGGKRRRGSESGGGGRAVRGKSKTVDPPVAVAAYQGLPNPFAGAGATPVAASPYESPQAAYGSVEPLQQQHQYGGAGDVDMDDDARSVGGSDAGYSEAESSKEYQVKAERKHRKIEGEKTIKPKRLKTHGITSGTYSIPFVPRYADGTPRLPLPIGIMILRKLGTVTHREHFHTERYIFPIGFEAMRRYPSMVDRTETVEYACTIVDGGDGAPRFEIHPADQPGVIISAGTPTGAWSQVVKAANRVRERNHSNSVSGPDYFGLSQNLVKALVQELPGAREVPGYIWQTFVEDPDPETLVDESGGRKKRGSAAGAGGGGAAGAAGERKVTGARRKARLESEGQEEMGQYEYGGGLPLPQQGQQYGGYQAPYGESNGYESSQRSPSPVTSPGGGGGYSTHASLPMHDAYNQPTTSSSLASLLHHAAQAQAQHVVTDPYALPGAPPSNIDPAFANDASPYALPPAAPVDPYAIPPPFGGSPPLQHVQQHGGWSGAAAVDPMFQQQPQPPSTGSAALDPAFF